MDSKFVIAIQGPTASGKTRVSIELAKWLNTDIVSCDSRQFYQELKIGSAPPTKSELKEIKHHFIQHISVAEELTAGEYEVEALATIAQIHRNANTAVLVGGSGLFAEAVLNGFDELPPIKPEIRAQLQLAFEQNGINFLQSELKREDPVYFERVDVQNPHRLIRALEVIRGTGKKYSELRTGEPKKRPFKTIAFAMNWDRQELYNRINARVDGMMEQGLLAEVESLIPYQKLQSLNTVGYKELFRFLDEEIPLEEAVSLIKRNSRRYAKRQLTWLRRNQNMHWVEPIEIDAMKQIILNEMKVDQKRGDQINHE